jgi:hypothetical protein
MPLTNYGAGVFIDHVLRDQAFTTPDAVYIALFLDEPDAAGSATEVSGGSYERQAVTLSAAASGATDNTGVVDFGEATGDWGEITHFGVMDLDAAGNMFMWGPLDDPKTVNTGDSAEFADGALDVVAVTS